jgi:hypothetical protein
MDVVKPDDPDLHQTPAIHSLYALSLFPYVGGFALFEPAFVPAECEVADVGIIECGTWRRIYNALDSCNKYRLPTLPSASLDRDKLIGRHLYFSQAFKHQK